MDATQLSPTMEIDWSLLPNIKSTFATGTKQYRPRLQAVNKTFKETLETLAQYLVLILFVHGNENIFVVLLCRKWPLVPIRSSARGWTLATEGE
jgi:hypothetical protein